MRARVRLAVVLVATSAVFGCAKATTNEATAPDAHKVDANALRKQLAFSLADHREWAAAVHLLLDLSVQHPRDPEVRTLLGTVYREQGLFEQAEASYGEAIRLDPRSARAYAGRGILREVRGDPGDAAVEDFRAAIRLSPDDAGYSNNLGFALGLRGRYTEAVAALQEALRHDPLSRRMRNNLGFVYGKLGQVSRAQREFEHGGTQDEVDNNLGYVYEQAGDVRTACAHYREALAGNPLLQVATDNAARACVNESSSKGRSP